MLCIYLDAVHHILEESTRKILQTRLYKDIVIFEISRKVTMDMLDPKMIINVEENGC